MLALALAAGLLIGTVVGALGAGGSVLAVPILVYLLDQEPYAATAGSLLVVGISALAGLGAYARMGLVQWRTGLTFGLLGVVGSLVGSQLSAAVRPDVLLIAFAGLLLAVAAATLSSNSMRHAEEPPGRPPSWCSPRVIGLATVVGLLTGFFGVGGGFIVVPALVVMLGLRMRDAVGTSLLVIVINATVAFTARGATAADELDWPMLAVFTSAAVGGGLLGARLAVRTRPKSLMTAFALLLIAIAIYTGTRSLSNLL